MADRERSRRAAILAVAPLHDDPETGMAWWNALSEKDRRYWIREADNTGRAVDAWEAFKRAGHREPELPAVSRASHMS
jgi:hypothetical protein